MRRLLIVSVVLLLVLAGCGTMQNKRDKTLVSTLDSYSAQVRWGGFEQGVGFLDPEWLKANPIPPLQLERYRQVRVSYYHEKGAPVIGTDEISQIVEIGVINEHSQSERVILDRQRWRWDEKAQRWWLMSGLPDITTHE
jgi:hypothetical protein